MYNQGHQQGQNVFMNGGHGHQRFAMQMNATKPFQGSQHHQAHAQHRQQQDHAGHGHGATFAAHQHNVSSSAFPGSSQHFNSNPVRNGTPTHLQNGLSRPHSDHWQQQLALHREAQEATGTHHHARNHPNNKASSGILLEQGKKDTEKEFRNRPSGTMDTEKHTWDELDLGGQGLRALSPGLFMFHFLRKLHLNNNNLTSLSPAIGQLRNLVHLDLSRNKLTVLPAEIGMLVQLKDLYLFDNELDGLPYELGFLFNLRMLGIEGNPDMNPDLKEFLMAEDGTKRLVQYLQDSFHQPEPPNERDWIEVDDSRALGNGGDTIKVMSWNSLCDKAATQAQFGYTPRHVLAWDYRKEMIIDEIRGREADIVALQEIDQENFHEWFRPQLAHNGYKGFYFPRSRARTMSDKESKLVDGCAIFYKDSKYILLDKQVIEYAHLAINRPDMKGEPDVFNRVMLRDHIAIVGFFENRQTGARVIAGNTHLFWDHTYRDVKVIQVAILMEQLGKLADGYAKFPPCKDKAHFRYTERDADGEDAKAAEPLPDPAPSQEYSSGPQIPLILCGDFNSVAGSGVCDLISSGSLARDHPDLGSYKYGNFTRDGITHPFTLKSAYSTKDLPFTNYTPGFKDMIDYIWYSTNNLQVTSLLGQIDKDYLQRVPGFPDYHYVSDHLALLAEFLIKPRKGVTGAAAPGGPAGLTSKVVGAQQTQGSGPAGGSVSAAGKSGESAQGSQGLGQDFGSDREGSRSVSRH